MAFNIAPVKNLPSNALTEVTSLNFAGNLEPLDAAAIASYISAQPANVEGPFDKKLQEKQVGKISSEKITNYLISVMADYKATIYNYYFNPELNKVNSSSLHTKSEFKSALLTARWPEALAEKLVNVIGWSSGQTSSDAAGAAIMRKLNSSELATTADMTKFLENL